MTTSHMKEPGALVFSLYAASEAYLPCMNDQEIAKFFIKRVRHLKKK